MNEFCAAMGICNLKHINEEICKRKKIVERYNYWLNNLEAIQLNSLQRNVESNYAYYPIIINKKSRNDLYNRLKEHGITARKYFYPITNTFDCYKDRFNPNETPIALEISEKVLTLPLYADLSLDIVDFICNIIIDFFDLNKM